MPSPKSGNADAAVPPAEPKEALEADKADPGEVDEVKAEQRQTQTGKYGSVQAKPLKASQGEEAKGKKKSWIEILLVDKKGKPVVGEAYRVTLPDGQTTTTGTLDEKGFARIEGIDPGNCKIAFPRLDKDTWKPK